MTTSIPATQFTEPAPAQRLERAAAALTAHGFTVEILDDAAAARTRIKDLIPEGAGVFTGASETLRLSGIDDDINTSGRYEAVKPRVRSGPHSCRRCRDGCPPSLSVHWRRRQDACRPGSAGLWLHPMQVAIVNCPAAGIVHATAAT
jgi:hypothetical protein